MLLMQRNDTAPLSPRFAGQFLCWRKKPEHARHEEECRHVTYKVAMFEAVRKCLNCHDCRMHDARPDGEGDQAAVFSWVPCSGNQKNAKNCIDTADHLQIVDALTAMPDPARRPHEAKRIDQQEDDTENNQREFQIALSGLVAHSSLPSFAVKKKPRTGGAGLL